MLQLQHCSVQHLPWGIWNLCRVQETPSASSPTSKMGLSAAASWNGKPGTPADRTCRRPEWDAPHARRALVSAHSRPVRTQLRGRPGPHPVGVIKTQGPHDGQDDKGAAHLVGAACQGAGLDQSGTPAQHIPSSQPSCCSHMVHKSASAVAMAAPTAKTHCHGCHLLSQSPPLLQDATSRQAAPPPTAVHPLPCSRCIQLCDRPCLASRWCCQALAPSRWTGRKPP